MGKGTPDPRKKAWRESTPKPSKEKTFFEPLSESALRTLPEEVIRVKLEQLGEVEELYGKNVDISATDYGRAMGVKGAAPQKDLLPKYRREMLDELERRRKANPDKV